MTGLCQTCRTFRTIAYTDPSDRSFCDECVSLLPPSQMQAYVDYLVSTIPYHPGDIVECRTGGQILDGIGHVLSVSTDPMDLASPVVPMFHVALDEKAYPECPDTVWYSEVCLELVTT